MIVKYDTSDETFDLAEEAGLTNYKECWGVDDDFFVMTEKGVCFFVETKYSKFNEEFTLHFHRISRKHFEREVER